MVKSFSTCYKFCLDSAGSDLERGKREGKKTLVWVTMSADRDWSNLPSDLLASISERLGPLDLLRFASVCSHWHRSVVIPSPRMPYLLFADKGLLGGSCALLNLSGNGVHRISPFPELRDKLFVGSQFGWLITLDEFVNVSLFDPVTRSRIDLPPITTLPFIKPIYDSWRTLIKYSSHRNLIWPLMNPSPLKLAPRTLRRNTFHRVVLSSDPRLGDGYTVVATYSYAAYSCTKLTLFVRAGEKKWMLLDEKWCLDDVIYHQGRFIAVSERRYIVSLDLSCNPAKTTTLYTLPEFEPHTLSYLVVDSLTGDLLHVSRLGYSNWRTHAMETVGITIRRLDSKEGTWSHVESLGKQSLFIGNCYSTALAAQDIPGLKLDCVYFTDDAWDMFDNVSRRNARDVGVLSLKDGHVERFNPPDNLPLIWPPPVFITPTIRMQQD